MYKLLLVDDEVDVREGLLHLIDWRSIGCEVVDTAENGREAMELVEKYLPDIVVTDIQMPFMNGLQLSEWIRSVYPDTKIVILTGFEEFEYAQRAVSLGIDDYLLKPFSAGELCAVLDKVKVRLDQQRQAKEDIQQLKEHYFRNLPVLRSLFLNSLVSHVLGREEILEKCSQYDLDLQGEGYMVAVIHRDEIQERDPELQLFAVLNVAEELVSRCSRSLVFIHLNAVIVLAVFDSRDHEEMTSRTLKLLEEIRYTAERYLKLTLTIGAGSAVNELSELNSSYQDAMRALDYQLILGNNKVIWIDDVEMRQVVPFIFDKEKERELIRCLKLGSDEELEQLLDELFNGLLDSRTTDQDLQAYLLLMLTAVVKAAQEMHENLDALFGETGAFLGQFSRLNYSAEAKGWFTGICFTLKRSIASERQTGYQKLVEEAKQFMNEHYQDCELSIGKVCKQLHISTGYFSNIFKKETKTTFVSYLMGLRMEAAKHLLLTTDMKSFEIAERVGFADPNYFSFCFRKKFGISPKEFRNGVQPL